MTQADPILPPVSTKRRTLEAQARVLDLLAVERSKDDVLSGVCRLIEQQMTGVHCCVMLASGDGSLTLGGAGSLPEIVRRLLSRLPDNAGLPCHVAAEYGQPWLTESIAHSELWKPAKDTFVKAGLESCWSIPIYRDPELQDSLAATLDVYYEAPQHLDLEERELVETASELVLSAIRRCAMLEDLVRQTQYDTLTGLPNRTLFGNRLEGLVQAERELRSEYRFAVVAIDIDQLKNINDTLGFNMGDYLLQAVGERLSSCVRKDDTVARSSGDEFLLLLKDIHRNEDVAMIAEKIRGKINAPYDFDGQGLFVTATLGISVYPWDGEDAHTLLRNAETALGHAKDLGGSGYQFFRPTMVRTKPTFEDWWHRSKLSNDLRDALSRDQFELFYQLKFDTFGKRVLGAEALIRWHHPELGFLPPGKFIPMCEQTGLIVPMGAWALEVACRQNQQWQNSGLSQFPISVNVTAHQFRHSDLISTITKVLDDTGLDAKYLELEITESLAMEDGYKALGRLQALHDLGLKLTIDDFGTGFSSLSYLNRFPVDTLKIDRSFIKDIGTDTENDADSRSIVLAILSVARALGMYVVAEGVETEAQLEFLRDNDCDEVQGFLLARPRDAATVTDTLINRS